MTRNAFWVAAGAYWVTIGTLSITGGRHPAGMEIGAATVLYPVTVTCGVCTIADAPFPTNVQPPWVVSWRSGCGFILVAVTQTTALQGRTPPRGYVSVATQYAPHHADALEFVANTMSKPVAVTVPTCMRLL